MPRVLVLFYSRTGNTAALADAIAEGAREVRFTEVDVRRIDDLAPESVIAQVPKWRDARAALAQRYRTLESIDRLADYDALVLGSPTRHGTMTAELKSVLDQTGPLWMKGAFVDKVGAAFTSAQSPHGGHETTVLGIMTVMASLGMILAPPGYTDPVLFQAGGPWGATATTGGGVLPGDADLAAARHQGRRVARIAEWIRHAKSHESHDHGPAAPGQHAPGHHHH